MTLGHVHVFRNMHFRRAAADVDASSFPFSLSTRRAPVALPLIRIPCRKAVAMAGHSLIVAGPERSGKTGKLLSRYRAALAEGAAAGQERGGLSRFGETLWIAPTGRAVNQVRESLVLGPGSTGGLPTSGALEVPPAIPTGGQATSATPRDYLASCFQPNVFTFEAFAQAILDHSDQLVRPVYGMARRQLIARLADELTRDGRLEYFRAIADAPGFVDLLSGFLSEMKRHEIWPDAFRQACVARGLTPKDENLFAFYDEYQAVLNRRQLFDAEGRFWTARTLLQNGQRRPFERLRFVVVDGFADFTATQHDILEVLAAHADEFVVSLPLERDVDLQDVERRRDLFAKPRATLERLTRRLPGARIEWMERATTPSWPEMDRLEQFLLGDPREELPAVADDGAVPRVEVIAAAQQIGEIRTIAARIKQLLIEGSEPSEGSSQAPVRPHDIVVVFRSTDAVAPLVSEVFEEYGLPFAIDRRPTLAESPRIKALLALLELDAKDWPFRGVLAVLGNNYVAPPQFAESLFDVQAAAERVVRALQIPSGAAKLQDRWRRLARHAEAGDGGEGAIPNDVGVDADDARSQMRRRRERDRAALRSLGYVEAVAAALAQLPDRVTPVVWATALESLGRTLGISTDPRQHEHDTSEARFALDAAAWNRLREVLRAGSRLSEWLEEPEETWTRRDMLTALTEICAAETIPIANDETGRIRVLSAPAARTLSAPYLFVASLSEHDFPRRAGDEVLYHEADRRRLAAEGLRLPQRSDRASEEMLLFYEVVTRATRRLYLSYPAMNDKAEPLLASPFLVDVERVLPHLAASRANVADLRPIPQATAGYSPADRRVLAVQEALDGKHARLAELTATPDRDRALGANLIAALRTNASRKDDGFGAMEGIVTTAAAKELLTRRFGADRTWSASHFEAYAHCPMRYFFEHVLRLEPPEEIELATDSRQRGRMLHAALAAAHRIVNAETNALRSPAEAEEAFRRGYAQQLEALRELMRRDTPLDDALLDVDAKLLAELIDHYLEQHRDYDQLAASLRPAHFEVSFGLPVDDGALSDALSTKQPLVLRNGDEEIRIGGRIDRIDVANDASGNRAMFGVVDYKTGNPIARRARAEQADDGRRLQLDLYALAVEQVLLTDRQALGVHSGYWHVSADGFDVWQAMHEATAEDLRPVDSWTTRKKRLTELVFALARGIRDGQFPVHSPDEHCTRFCSFKTICRVHQARSLEKTWRPPVKE
jgi:ATP-dependent helicase/nuclease subunit B